MKCPEILFRENNFKNEVCRKMCVYDHPSNDIQSKRGIVLCTIHSFKAGLCKLILLSTK